MDENKKSPNPPGSNKDKPGANKDIKPGANKAPAAGANKTPTTPGPPPVDRRQSVIVPPDRHQQIMNENTRRVSSVHPPNVPIQINQDRRRSVIQQPSSVQISLPDKIRKNSVARAPLLAQLQQLHNMPNIPINPIEKGNGFGTGSNRNSAPDEMLRRQSVVGPPGSGSNRRKLSKAEVEEYYSRIKAINRFHKSHSAGSLMSYASTMSSISSALSVSSDMAHSWTGSDFSGIDWSQRWIVDKAGKQPGQIKCAKDVCFFGDSNYIAVAESKNARVQIFSTSGKSLATLGPDSSDSRTAQSFNNPMNFRKIEPTGICESYVHNLLAVTDHNRILYIDASAQGRLVTEVIVNNRNSLHGIACLQDEKLIITEVGTQASVGLFETNGRLIREYKGDFKAPAYVAWNDEIEVAAVSDCEQRAVYLYDANGHLLNKISKQLGSQRGDEEVGPLVYPSGISWFSEGRLLIADRAENRVILVDLRNMQAENILTDQDGIGNPVALATNQKNRIVLTEEFYDFGVDKFHLKLFKHKSQNAENYDNNRIF